MNNKPQNNALIKATGLPLEELAERIGVSLATMKSYSCGRLKITAENETKIKQIIKKNYKKLGL